jgi:amidohydrolase
VARNVDPLESAVVTVGELHAGTALNIIADTARLSGTVRYFNPALSELIPQRIEQIIAGICQSHGASYDLEYWRLYPPVINNPDIAELVRSVAAEVIETPSELSQSAKLWAVRICLSFCKKYLVAIFS